MRMKNTDMIKKITKVTANIMLFVMGFLLVGANIAFANSAAINGFLNVDTSMVLPAEDGDIVDTEYFKSVFNSVAEVKANGADLARQIVAEGSVLLKNENDALPLSEGSNVSLFSTSSVDLVYAGTGSSGTNTSGVYSLKEGLEEDGKLSVNEDLWNWYTENLETYGRSGSNGGSIGATFGIGDAEWDEITTEGKTNAAYGDAAIFVLSRKGGEGADLTISGGDTSDLTNGNYLQLSPTEIDVLEHLKAEKDKGTFKKIIVLMNTANPVQCDFVDDDRYGIDAMIWCGDLGAVGVFAVGDILVGRVNPSGRLSDTFWKEHWLNPVYANWGDKAYEQMVVGNDGETSKHNKYVVYQEGIYNGYLYTETRYEDTVLNRKNVGEFNYYDVVSYPFGFGLSYTSFDYSDFEVTYNEPTDTYTVSITVTNTGDVAGKEVVQIYLQKPYTEYDIANGIEKAAVELVGYAKTKELAPNASETLTIEVEKKYFASYDANNAKTYIVDAGDYFLTAAKDAHDAVNNILAAKGKTVADGMTAAGNTGMVAKFTENELDTVSYSISAATGAVITNQFDNADINKYDGRGTNGVTYVTRNNWEGTVKLGYDAQYNPTGNVVKLVGTEQMTIDMNPVPTPDDIEYPTYGSTETSYMLIDLRAYEDGTPIEYDNPMWDDLLDQLTWDETVNLLSRGLRMTYSVESIGKPQTIDHNGATGPVQPYGDNPTINRGLAIDTNDPDMGEKPTLYPSNGLAASTYNRELVKKYGEAWGEDCLWAGYAGLYGPGLNAHRGAYGGRSFEYFSEDAFLSGTAVAELSKGMKEKGAYVYLKHVFLNDQETNREGVSTWANEQTIREVYLRSFQIAIEEGGAECVMTGFNRLGVEWTGNQGFLNSVLRAEFGMTGLAVTDWFMTRYLDGYMTMPYAMLMGQDIPDGDALAESSWATAVNYLGDYATGYGAVAWAMRDATHRILYTVVQSNAMNGISSGTRVIQIVPAWQTALEIANYVSIVLFAISAVAFAAYTVMDKKKSVK